MFLGMWSSAKANKENIFYTILTVFLLERVRRGWNRIETRGRAQNLSPDEIERGQQRFTFTAALLYAVPFVLPCVKYVYRSVGELSHTVGGLSVFSSLWALAAVTIATEALLAVVIYNLLGIYVERMNGALGFFRAIGRSVADGSRVAVQAGGSVGRGVVSGTRTALRGLLKRSRSVAVFGVRRAHTLAARAGARALFHSQAIINK